MYRTNINLTDEMGARLTAYADRTGIPKVNVISMALDQYLNEQELKQRILEELKDPEKMGTLMRALGINSVLK